MRPMLLAVGLFVAAACSACGAGSRSGQAPSPSTSGAAGTPQSSATGAPSVMAADCAVSADLCAFAFQTEALLAQGAAADVVGDAPGQPVTCTTGVNPGLGAEFPLCDGATPGETRTGFKFGRFQSEGGMSDRTGMVHAISEWLAAVEPVPTPARGGEAVRVLVIGCPDAPAADCRAAFSLTFRAVHQGGVGEFLMLVFRTDEPDHRQLTAMYTGLFEINAGYFSGAQQARLDPGDPSSPTVRFIPLRR